jgi:hypothetical protein
LFVVVYVGLAAVFVGWVLMWLVAVAERRVVVLVLVAGGQMGPVLAAAQVVGYMGVFVVVDLGIVAVLVTHGQASSVTGPSSAQRSVESVSSPLSLVLLSLPESEESLSSPLSPSESEESASSPVSPSLTVAPPWARTSPGQVVLISSSSR